MFIKKKDNFIFTESKRKNKKYDVYDAKTFKYINSFGDKRYMHFYDVLQHYKHLNHNDINRLKRYYQRHGLNAKPLSAKYFSHKYLWPLKK